MKSESQRHSDAAGEGQSTSADDASAQKGRPAGSSSPTIDLAADSGPSTQKNSPERNESTVAPLPPAFGRYVVRAIQGQGGFGTVYRGHDTQLDRQVAIKVSQLERFGSSSNVEHFLKEARRVARLKHPSIVVVHDVGVQEGHCYIVSDFVEGTDLSNWLRDHRPTWAETSRIIADVAEALAYAHTQRIVHRDVKPSNIILTDEVRPVLVDFGLALSEDEMIGREYHRVVGTPAYMSPEQARGEGHRIDGRTDIYSLGVVMYRLLCGRTPFRGDGNDELLRQVREDEPQPPRQLVRAIPRELERICLKAIAKRINDRYSTGQDMADDLRQAVLEQPEGATKPPGGSAIVITPRPVPSVEFADSRQFAPVVPKGIRSFGPEDSEFFLELLPGPRDREGLPDSIRFWKTRIESRDPDSAFHVGLIYAPSGAGKSSLVKAGLLPHLADSVMSVYVEATQQDTEARLAKGLRRACSALDPALRLSEVFASLRRGRGLPTGRKLLVVVDQFEQWLHSHGTDMERSELVSALRHADGEHVQVLLMARDDFWMGISRLFDCLEINLDREHNTRSVDLFDLRHAQRVLFLFGQAFDRMPMTATDLTEDQKKFLEQAALELSHDGRVISVRLSLFAEMMKERPWTTASLVEVGGTEGVGVRFLEETFTSRAALPDHRAFEKPARALLQALLPEPGIEIKGQMRSRQELAQACGLPQETTRFARLIELLDRELHLITPTETESEQVGGGEGESGANVKRKTEDERPERETNAIKNRESRIEDPAPTHHLALTTHSAFYQLTHDFLVPPLRQWLTLERRKTWRGRAESCLEERTAQMSRWPQSRFLPSLAEFLVISFGVPRRKRKPEQRALLGEAARYHGVRWGSALAAVLVVGLAIQWYVSTVRNTSRLHQTEALVAAVLSASPEGVPPAIGQLQPYRDLAIPLLSDRFRESPPDSDAHRHAAFALAALGEVELEFLVKTIADAPPREFRNTLIALWPVKESAYGLLMEKVESESDPELRARYAAALLHLQDPRGAQLVLAPADDPVFRTEFIRNFDTWHGDLTVLPDLLRQNDDPAFRSGICAALGSIKPDSLGTSERAGLSEVLSELFRSAPDGGTHSAAGWALRQWNFPLPQVERTQSAPKGRGWFVNRLDMTMLEIESGTFMMGDKNVEIASPHRVTLTEAFFVCDREVWVGLFRRFIEDNALPPDAKPQNWRGPDQRNSPTDDCPVQTVSWADAVLFCNWLSRQEGRRACYKRTSQARIVEEDGVESDDWTCDFKADGYRLLSEAQWEFACRAGSNTSFWFGNEYRHLLDYECYRDNAHEPNSLMHRTWPVASRLPNLWGLFDMLGNVMEWCNDWYGPFKEDEIDPKGPPTGSGRVTRGGCWASLLPRECQSVNRRFFPPSYRRSTVGFRVGCKTAIVHTELHQTHP